MDLPSLRQLEYVLAIAEHRHFTRAAEACCVSQPALSSQVAQLEEQLGVVLFERSRRGVHVTPAGERFLPSARAAIAALETAVESARGAAEPLRGPLRLGVIPTIAPYLLPDALPRVRSAWPELELHLREEQTAVLLELLAQARLDVLLLALPVSRDDIESVVLLTDEFVACLPLGHPLAKRRSVKMDDLADETVLLLEDGHCLRDQALSACQVAGLQEQADVRATSLHTLLYMVAGGLGVTLVPAMATRHLPADVVVVPFTKPRPGREIGLAWRAGSVRAEEYRLLGQSLRGEG
ncbi:MAG: LysR substrate-binding domain-containing protein [Acidobacteriota bacterium]